MFSPKDSRGRPLWRAKAIANSREAEQHVQQERPHRAAQPCASQLPGERFDGRVVAAAQVTNEVARHAEQQTLEHGRARALELLEGLAIDLEQLRVHHGPNGRRVHSALEHGDLADRPAGFDAGDPKLLVVITVEDDLELAMLDQVHLAGGLAGPHQHFAGRQVVLARAEGLELVGSRFTGLGRVRFSQC
jgi:hypothetical protein